MTAEWAGVLVAVVVFILSAAASTAIVIGRVNAQATVSASEQQATRQALKEMTGAIAELAKGAAVNQAQHDDLSRRISNIELTLGKHAEAIHQNRTALHMANNALQKLEPSFRPYRSGTIED